MYVTMQCSESSRVRRDSWKWNKIECEKCDVENILQYNVAIAYEVVHVKRV